MRRALAAAGVLGAVALSPVATQAAWAEPATAPTTVQAAGTIAIDDEPLSEDGDDDTAKYGLVGLTGMFGLFGYKKIKQHRATRTAPPTRPTGTTGTSRPVGDVDDDGSGSRRI